MSDGKMVTCANCGNERPEGTRFCGNCGTPFPQADQAASPAGPPSTTSSTRARRLVWVAVAAAAVLLVAGSAVAAVLSITGGDGSNQATPTDTLDFITNTTDVYGDTTDTPAVVGQGVDQTCEDLVGFFALAKDADLARGGSSVSDVERVAEEATDLASRAPAESTSYYAVRIGEPRVSLTGIGEAYWSYVALLSELGLEPGPDAMLEPSTSGVLSDAQSSAEDLALWIEYRCSADVKARIAALGNG